MDLELVNLVEEIKSLQKLEISPTAEETDDEFDVGEPRDNDKNDSPVVAPQPTLSIDHLREAYSKLDRSAYDEKISLLEKMKTIEKSNPDLYYRLYEERRYKRRAEINPDGLPNVLTQEEIISICKAAELDPNNPKILFARCHVMIEIFKSGIKWNGRKCFGQGIFVKSSEEILKSVQDEVRRALTLNPKSEITNILASEIYSVALPAKFRDLTFAKLCLERALLFNPNAPNANARMAAFYANFERNLEVAEKFYLKAVECDKKKELIYPLLDLFQSVYMIGNKEKFEELMEVQLADPDWDNFKRAKFLYVKGLHNINQGELKAGLQCWFDAYALDEQIVEQMKTLDRSCSRYNWPDALKTGNIYGICGTLQRGTHFPGEFKKVLMKFRTALGSQQALPPVRKGYPSKRKDFNAEQGSTNNFDRSDNANNWVSICTTFPDDENFATSSYRSTRPARDEHTTRASNNSEFKSTNWEDFDEECLKKINRNDAIRELACLSSNPSREQIDFNYNYMLCSDIYEDPEFDLKDMKPEHLAKIKDLNEAYELLVCELLTKQMDADGQKP